MNQTSQDISSLKKQTITATRWLFAGSLIIQLISWSFTIILARILIPEDYGLLGMAQLLIAFFALFNEVGLGAAIIHKKNITKEELSSCYWIIIGINIFLYLIAFLLAPFVSHFFQEERITGIIRVMAIAFVINSAYSVHYNLLAKELLFKKRSIIEFVSRLSNNIASLLLAVSGYGVWSLVYGLLIGSGIALVLSFAYVQWFPLLLCSYSSVKRMLNYGYKVQGTRLLWYFYSNADFLIAGRFLGKVSLGYYTMGFTLANLPLEKIVSNIKQISFPFFSKIQDDDVALRNYYLKIVRIVAFIVFPLFSGMALAADKAVIVLLSEKWLPMVTVFIILCITATMRAISILSDPLINAKGRPEIGLANVLMCAIVMPVAFFIGCRYGLNGLALAWMFVYPFLFLWMTRRAIKVIDLSLLRFIKNLTYPISATIFMSAIVLLVKILLADYGSNLLQLVFICVSGAIAYAFFIIIFARDFLSDIKPLIKA